MIIDWMNKLEYTAIHAASWKRRYDTFLNPL